MTVLPDQGVAFRATADGVQQFFGRKRFWQVVDRPCLDRLHGELGGCVGGDHQGGNIGPAFVCLGKKFIPAHAVKMSIGHHHEVFPFGQLFQSLFGTLHSLDLKAFVDEHGLQGKPHVLLVVDKKKGGEGGTHDLTGTTTL